MTLARYYWPGAVILSKLEGENDVAAPDGSRN